MTIHVTPIPSTLELAAPAFTFGGSNAAGDAVTAVASNSTIALIATEAEMETATSTALAVSPGRAQYHPGIVKVWVQSTETGALTGSYNVASVDDNGTGDWTVHFATDFSAATYAVSGLPISGGSDILLRVADSTNDDKCYIHAVVGGTKTNTAWFAMFTGTQ